MVLGGNPKIDNYIDQATRFKASGYEHADPYKKGEWDGFTRLYNNAEKTFPLGLLETVEMMLILKDVAYETIDNRVYRQFILLPITHEIQLRDYQQLALDKAIEKQRCLLQLPTGSGKTLIGISLTGELKLPTVFYVHKKELLYQTLRTYRKSLTFPQCKECPKASRKKTGDCDWKKCLVGIVGDGQADIKPITIAMIQSVKRLPKELFTDFGIAIFDECLHKNSQILLPGNKCTTIKKIYENPNINYVMSYNEKTQAIEPKKIIRKIRNPMLPDQRWKKIVISYTENDTIKITTIMATPNHKIWTPNGFRPAGDLKVGDRVKWAMTDPEQIYPCKLCERTFNNNSALGGHVNMYHINYDRFQQYVRSRPSALKNPDTFHKGMITRGKNLKYRKYLSDRMKKNNPMSNPTTRKKAKESMHKIWDNPEKLQERLKNYMNAPKRGRENRDRTPTRLEQAIINMNIPHLKYTGNGDFWLTIDGKHKNPDFVVDNHQKKVVEIGDIEYWHTPDEIQQVIDGYKKAGWNCLYITNKELDANPEKVKGRILKFVCNHEAIITHIETARGRPKGRAFRYNLEIEGNHNYFANGILVSNCHHISAQSVFDIAKDTKSKYLVGLSATVRREDGKELMLQAGAGPVSYNLSISELIRRKYLAKPHIHAIPVSPVMFSNRDNYNKVYEKAIVYNTERNDKIILTALELCDTGPVYIHVKRIDHGHILVNLINNKLLVKGLTKAVFIDGSDKTDYRREVLDKFRHNELPILISTLLGEGVDLPNMYGLILASGGLSRTQTIQVFGRLLRISEHDVVVFVDIADRCKYLYEHFLARVNFYQSEPEFELEDYIKKLKTE